jgi:hypothetical protein
MGWIGGRKVEKERKRGHSCQQDSLSLSLSRSLSLTHTLTLSHPHSPFVSHSLAHAHAHSLKCTATYRLEPGRAGGEEKARKEPHGRDWSEHVQMEVVHGDEGRHVEAYAGGRK